MGFVSSKHRKSSKTSISEFRPEDTVEVVIKETHPLFDVKWRLTKHNSHEFEHQCGYLRFFEQTYQAYDGVNDGDGYYTFDLDNYITFGGLAMTEMGSMDPGDIRAEQAISTLYGQYQYDLDDVNGILTLISDDNVLVFCR